MDNINFPPQALPFNKKTKKWRKAIVDWADSKTFLNYSLCRKSTIHKKINYDLLNGKLHMEDLAYILNPDKIKANFVPDRIQHYPIINSKLDVLRGEELERVFDYRVVVTNPNAVSEIENNKKKELLQRLQEWVSNTSQSEEEAQQRLNDLNDYSLYEWQDAKEVRANCLLNHYVKELNMPLTFNKGFVDGLAVGEEIYKCDIVGGEPTLEKVNTLKIRIFRSGYSNKVEDADMIILEDYWSPGKIIDTYYDVLSKKDIEYIDNLPSNFGQGVTDSMDNVDERFSFINTSMLDETFTESLFTDPLQAYEGLDHSLLPYDMLGNIRVIQVYWKSKRRIKKVKSYNPETGEEEFNFYPETYVIDKNKGEEEEIFYINEAWEGTKIGEDIYVNMRPRVVQYNRLSNPSRCHFGIVGSIYNLNDDRPFSLVDKMKPFNYLYDVIHDRLNKLISRNWGTLLRLDLAKKPNSWDIDKWMYYAKTMGLAVENSFNEGRKGASMGKLAGGLNNASSGIISATDGNAIQQYIQLLEYIKNEMSDCVGISRQREGTISNRETVGGVERATLQSSYITEWLYAVHDDVKKRALECFLETAKIALRGKKKKFQYILSDNSMKIMDIDGDEFAECDYGLILDMGKGSQALNQKLDTLAQAALQNQTISFSTMMKLFNSCSLAEKQRIVEKDEQAIQQRQQEAQQQQMQLQQQQMEQQAQLEQAKMQQEDTLNQRDNETKILVAQINGKAEAERFAIMNDDPTAQAQVEQSQRELEEKAREFDATLKLNREKLEHDKTIDNKEIQVKKMQINASKTKSTKK